MGLVVSNRRRRARAETRQAGARAAVRLPSICLISGLLAAAWLPAGGAAAAEGDPVEELRNLSIEDLSNLEITSVSRRPQPLSAAPAAIYVITAEDIRRSGATSLPEVLRLAPNLQVARVNSRSYAISARGFGSFESANKLLVLIDGRSIYTTLHGGVLWDEHAVLLADIERIEVVSGPGGTLWGANAVNGVINIITKNAHDTEGGLVSGGYGSLDQHAELRYGGKLSEETALRVYGLGFGRGDSRLRDGEEAGDDWDGLQGGFRLDWQGVADAATIQGDLFEFPSETNERTYGGNLLARWSHSFTGGSALVVQAFYDRVSRTSSAVEDAEEKLDISAQHTIRLGPSHTVVWGGGYRFSHDRFVAEAGPFTLLPRSRDIQLGNLFAQDTIALADDLSLTLGTKVEHSSFSGTELLPNARLAWQVAQDHLLWSAVSRAARTPTRIDRDLQAPGLVDPGRDFDSEELIAYELGYRGQLSSRASLSVSLYYNDYDELRALAISPDSGLLEFDNVMEGHTYGLEAWGDYQVNGWWRLSAGVNLLEKDLHVVSPGTTLALDQHQGNDPEYQLSLRSSMDLSDDVDLDIGLRAIDDLPSPDVPGYIELDARVGWEVVDGLELSLVGNNLLHDQHPETGNPITRREIPRSVMLGASWKF